MFKGSMYWMLFGFNFGFISLVLFIMFGEILVVVVGGFCDLIFEERENIFVRELSEEVVVLVERGEGVDKEDFLE